MATRLEILIAGESLDLFDGEESKFYITKIIHDIRNLETRNGDFSKSITIPANSKNKRILGNYVPVLGRNQNDVINALPVDVNIGGVPVLDESFLVVGSQNVTKQTLEITVLGGASLFFNELKEEPLNALDFSELDLEWSIANIPERNIADIIGNVSTGICFARSQWYTNESRRLFIDQGGTDVGTRIDYTEVGESGFFMWCKTVMDKIFSNMDNLTVDQSKMDLLYEQIAFAVPVPIVHESFNSESGFFGEVRSINPAQSFPINVRTIAQYQSVFSDDDNLWTNYKFTLAVDAFVTIQAGASFKNSTSNGQYYAFIYKNETPLADVFVNCPNPSNYYGFNLSTTDNGLAGDEYTVRILLARGSSLSGLPLNNGYFRIENQGAGRGRSLSVSSVLPDITQRDFVKEIFKVQNILPVTKNKVVTLEYFENIRTNKINDFIRLDVSRDIQVFSTLPSYGRSNAMKYADNEMVERDDMNAEFVVDNATLQDEVVKVELAFSASDDNTIPFAPSNFGVTIPNYDIEWNFVNDNKMQVGAGSPNYTTTDRNDIKAGDFIELDGQRRRVLSVLTDFTGVCDANFPSTLNDFDWNHWRFNALDVELHLAVCKYTDGETHNVSDGGTIRAFTGCVTSEFTDTIKFGTTNGLINTYYDLLTKSMRKPFIIQAWANLGVVLFLQTNSTLPIYIEEFDAYFYLNKMEQWKYNQGTRLELIQLNL